MLSKKLTQACVPEQARGVLYNVVQSQLLQDWHDRQQNPRKAQKMLNSAKNRDGPVVRQTRASRCGAVWTGRRCEHFDSRESDGHYLCTLSQAGNYQATRSGIGLNSETGEGGGVQTPMQKKKNKQSTSSDFSERTLHVRRIPPGDFEEEEAIRNIFAPYGQVVSVSLRPKSSDIAQRLSWALVTMCDTLAMNNVLEHCPIFAGEAELGVTRVKAPQRESPSKRDDTPQRNAHPTAGAFAELYIKAAQRVARLEGIGEQSVREEGSIRRTDSRETVTSAQLRPLSTSQLNQAGSGCRQLHSSAQVTKTGRTRPSTAPASPSASPGKAQIQTEKAAQGRGGSASRHRRQQAGATPKPLANRPVSAPASPQRGASNGVRPRSSSSSLSSYASDVRSRSPSSAGPPRMREARRAVAASCRGGK